jgi:predicted TIM-barrel fold metal-dependent hydrolase
MIIDAHQHLWTADYAWLAEPALARIRRDYTLGDLRAAMASAGVDRTVLVEAGRCDDGETTSFLALARDAPEIAGLVGWASLPSPSLAGTIARHRAGPGGDLLVGLRDQVQGEADDYLDRVDVRAKLSGLVTEADWATWTPADLRPFVQTAVELFGPSRLMFGSDWPVLEVAATYAQVKDVLIALLGGSPADVFGGTAIRTYHLEIT